MEPVKKKTFKQNNAPSSSTRLFQFIRSLDLFGESIPICYERDIRYRTLGGGIFSLLFVILLTTICVFLIRSFFMENRFTIVTNISSDFKKPINLTNIPILIALYNTTGDPIDIDPKLFSFRVIIFKTLITYGPEGRKVYDFDYPVRTIRCDFLKQKNPEFLQMFSTVYIGMNFSRYMCIEPGEDLNIYGTIGDIRNGWQGFRVYVDKCKNNETNPDYCYDKNTTDFMMEGTEVAFGFEGDTINTLEKESIKREVYSVGGDKVDLQYTRRYYHRISKGLYKEDHGLFYSRFKETDFFTMEDKTEEMDLYQTDSYFGYIQFNTNGRYNTVIKTPQNPLSFIGTLGGLINASYMFISTIFGLLYDKLLVFDIIAKFEGKIRKNGCRTSIKNMIEVSSFDNNMIQGLVNNSGVNQNGVGGNDATALQMINGSGFFSGQRNKVVVHRGSVYKKPSDHSKISKKISHKNLQQPRISILNLDQEKKDAGNRLINDNFNRILSLTSSENLTELGEDAKYYLEQQSRKLKCSIIDINKNKWNYILCPFTFQRLQASFQNKKHIFFIFCQYFDIMQFYKITNLGYLLKRKKET